MLLPQWSQAPWKGEFKTFLRCHRAQKWVEGFKWQSCSFGAWWKLHKTPPHLEDEQPHKQKTGCQKRISTLKFDWGPSVQGFENCHQRGNPTFKRAASPSITESQLPQFPFMFMPAHTMQQTPIQPQSMQHAPIRSMYMPYPYFFSWMICWAYVKFAAAYTHIVKVWGRNQLWKF